MPEIKNKNLIKFLLLFSILALCGAYFVQYAMGHEPCNLCLLERIPYIVSIIIISLLLITKKKEKLFLAFLTVIFFLGTIISFYHFGIEQNFFEESFVCNLSESFNSISKEDLLKQLENNIISCKDVEFYIFGFSLATLNTIASFLISLILIKATLNYEKN